MKAQCCMMGHSFCIEARWDEPPTSRDNMENRSSHPMLACWGVEFDEGSHPESIRALVNDRQVLEWIYEHLAADLVGLGVDFRVVSFSGRGG